MYATIRRYEDNPALADSLAARSDEIRQVISAVDGRVIERVTPEQALDCFLRTQMDVLVMGETVLRRKDTDQVPL